MSVSGQTRQHCSLWGLSTETSTARLPGRRRIGYTLRTCVPSASESVGVLSMASVFLWKPKSRSQNRVRMEESVRMLRRGYVGEQYIKGPDNESL